MTTFTLTILAAATAGLALLGNWWRQAATRPATAPRPAAWAPPLPPGPLVVSTLAGHPLPPPHADGHGAAARFRQLRALAVDQQGNV